MGLFSRSPKSDEATAPFLDASSDESVVIPAAQTAWAYKKVSKAVGVALPSAGGSTTSLEVVLRVKAGVVWASHGGYPLGSSDDRELRGIVERAGGLVRVRGYIWRSARDHGLGLRVFVPGLDD
ncbi:hypothetical protein [Sanguibacter massiliensis]|uniref:hypothetical protein n=1 Tax=Sanguibacter massiliensis TaxID=1973217 RepID=UPI001F5DBA60|nr:hypothetical protein [Sanguibacter massiliensis]